MFNSTLELIIKARDEATAVIKDLNKKTKDMQPAFEKMAAAGTIAFGAVAFAVNEFVSAAGESEAVSTQLNAVLKSTGGIAGVTSEAAKDLAGSLQNITTYGDEAILSAQNILLTFTKIKNDVFPEATKTVLDMSTALGQDLKSSSIQLGKALNDPIQGITALSRVGVSFTETQKDMIEKLVKSGDIMSAQKIILAELATEFGGSATAAATTFSGGMTQVKNQIGEVFESIGKSLLPSLNDFVIKIKPVISNIQKWIDENPMLVKTIVATALSLAALTAALGAAGVAFVSFTALSGTALGAIIGFMGPLAAVAAATAYFAAKISDSLTTEIRNQIAIDNEYSTKIGELTDKLTKLREPIRGNAAEMKAMAEQTAQAAKKVSDLNDQISRATEEHLKTQQTLRQNLGNEIVNQEKKIADLQKDIAEKVTDLKKAQKSKESADSVESLRQDLTNLRASLQQEQDALRNANITNLGIDTELKEARRRAALTEFERKIEDFKADMELENKKYNDKILKLRAELAEATKQKNALSQLEANYTLSIKKEEAERLKAVEETTAAIKASMAERSASQNISSSTKKYVGDTPLSRLGTGIANVLGINDGIVQNGRIITTHPDDYIVATKTPGTLGGGNGGITVNINGGNYLSQDAALEMGDYIIKALRTQMRGA